MARCKPGDLAVIIRADIPEWIGVLVTVIERDEYWSSRIDLLTWRVKPHCSAGKIAFVSDGTKMKWDNDHRFFVLDRDLRPIRTGDLEDDESTPVEKKEPALAADE